MYDHFLPAYKRLTKFKKQLYLGVQPVAGNGNPFKSNPDSDDELFTPILSPEQEAESRTRYLIAAARRVARGRREGLLKKERQKKSQLRKSLRRRWRVLRRQMLRHGSLSRPRNPLDIRDVFLVCGGSLTAASRCSLSGCQLVPGVQVSR